MKSQLGRFQIFTDEYIQADSKADVSPATFDSHVTHPFHVHQFPCPQMNYPQSCLGSKFDSHVAHPLQWMSS
ncbi:hypothetical protein YC2023_037179 [Brassica napus]